MIGLRIAREWGKHPRWFFEQDKDVQISLIAEKVLTNETTESRDTRRERHARDKNN